MKSRSAQDQAATVKTKKVKHAKGPAPAPIMGYTSKVARTETNKKKRIERDAKRKAEAAAKKMARKKKIKSNGHGGGNADQKAISNIEQHGAVVTRLPDSKALALVARWQQKQVQRNTNHGDRNV